MDNFLSLKLLDLFGQLFDKSGIDYKILRNIVKTKLVLDTRSAPIVGSNKKQKESNSFFMSYIGHLIMGVFLAVFIYFIGDEMVRMIYFAGAFFFLTSMYLISDFSSVLLDTKDKNILLTKPVDSKTVSMSKLIHVIIYMSRLNTFLAGPSLAAIVMRNGFFTIPVFLIEVLLMDLLIFLLTAFIYLLVLRFFDGETLRNVINYIQIALTILVTVGYQIAVRVIDFTSIHSMKYNFSPLHYFNPILWFGAPFEIIYNGGNESYLYVFTALLIIVPIICFIGYLKLSRSMETLLLKLEGEGKEKRINHHAEIFLGKLLNRDEASRQSFYFVNAVLRSDRSLKLKIYPELASVLLISVIMIFNVGVNDESYEVLGFEYVYLYINFLFYSSLLNLMHYSSAWKGSYVYFTSGMENTRAIYKGLLQTVAIRILMPMLICNSIIYLLLFKSRFVLDLIIIFLASIMILPIIGKIYFSAYPFSKPIDESIQKNSFSKFIKTIVIVAVYAVLHVLSHKITYGVWAYIILLIAGIFSSWRIFIPNNIQKLECYKE